MDAKAAMQERSELFENAFDFKHNPRVPMLSNFWTWKYLDAGYDLNEALYDYEVMDKVITDFHELYRFDAYMEVGFRNPMRVAQALGGGFHYVDESGEALLIDDNVTLERDEYIEFATDPTAFYWSKLLKRTAKPGLTLRELKNAVMEFMAFGEFVQRMNGKLANEFGALSTQSQAGMAFMPLDNFFIGLRGMKELAIDIVKCKDVVREALEIIYQQQLVPQLANAANIDQTGCIAQLGSVFFAHSILSVKNFEELYWPYLKKFIDVEAANHLRMFIFCESAMLRFAEFFEDVPKGVLMIHVEQDDIFEFRRRLPNIAVSGGMPTRLLGYGTPEECVDYAKRLIDTLGEGYVMSQDKMMSYRKDARRENLLAVNDFVLNYSY